MPPIIWGGLLTFFQTFAICYWRYPNLRPVALNGGAFVVIINDLVWCDVVITADISLLAADASTSAIFAIVILIGNASILWVILKLVKGVCFILPVKKLALPPLVIKDFNHLLDERHICGTHGWTCNQHLLQVCGPTPYASPFTLPNNSPLCRTQIWWNIRNFCFFNSSYEPTAPRE